MTDFTSARRGLEELRSLPESGAVREALRSSAEVLAERVREMAPVASGSLRESVAVRVAGGSATVETGGPGAPYANIVEFGGAGRRGQFFMAEALESAKPEIVHRFALALERGSN